MKEKKNKRQIKRNEPCTIQSSFPSSLVPNQKMSNFWVQYKALAFFLLLGIAILFSLIGSTVVNDYDEYKEVEDTQQEIIDDVVTENEEIPFTVDWNKLKSINNDIVAWIRIPDTNISYPVVQGSSNKQYLRKNIYGNYSRGGVPFVDANISKPFECPNTIIYGHNLANGAMFSQLKNYSKNEFAEEHNIVYMYLPTGEIREYKVFSFHIVQATDKNIYNPYVENLEEYKGYMMQNNKITNNDMEIQMSDEVITLSTCTNKGESRYVLHCIYHKNDN